MSRNLKLVNIAVFVEDYISESDVNYHVEPFLKSVKDLPGVVNIDSAIQDGPEVNDLALTKYALELVALGVDDVPALEAAQRVLDIDATGLIAEISIQKALREETDKLLAELDRLDAVEEDEDSAPETEPVASEPEADTAEPEAKNDSFFDRFFSTPR